MKCVVCLKDLQYMWPGRATNIADGIDFTVTGSYGSKHDTDTFIGYICDECVTDRLERE